MNLIKDSNSGIHKNIKLPRDLIGKKAKQDGKTAEKMFEMWCDYNEYVWRRIHDGGFQTASKQFIRTPQLCDYILFHKRTSALEDIYFIDVKLFKKETLPRNYFFSERKKPTPTQRQTQNFKEIYTETLQPNFKFHFVDIDKNHHYEINIVDILDQESEGNKQFTLRKIRP